ncbi:MAG TPA: hypothetical protein VG965_03600 [Patescibacteria group bacterium]|nr:hypothetical protein [Patescibacteria group bacterium]
MSNDHAAMADYEDHSRKTATEPAQDFRNCAAVFSAWMEHAMTPSGREKLYASLAGRDPAEVLETSYGPWYFKDHNGFPTGKLDYTPDQLEITVAEAMRLLHEIEAKRPG